MGEERILMQTLLEKYVINGGVLMFVLIPCSLLMVAGVLQGLIVLRRGRMTPKWLLRKADKVQDAPARRAFLLSLKDHSSPLARILWLTLKDFNWAIGRRPERQAIQAPLDEAIILVSDKLYDRVGLMSTIYTIGPLLGLVGTIVGLMDTFHAYGAQQQPSIQMLAVGVQKALVTTLWGLAMAIPAFVAGQWMQGKIRRYERDLFPACAWQVIEAIYDPPLPEAAASESQDGVLITAEPAAEMESPA